MLTMEFDRVCIINHTHYISAYFCLITAAVDSLITQKQITKYETSRPRSSKDSVAGWAAQCTLYISLKAKAELQSVKKQSLDYPENTAPFPCLLKSSLLSPSCGVFWLTGSCKRKQGNVFVWFCQRAPLWLLWETGFYGLLFQEFYSLGSDFDALASQE